ncbi:MAG: hypothetical protein EKK64_03695 [Neisseriaceae bacterium]|nr:MAG: hypothetical protein EKK64_03695 [Neisseriaceae bacterium]
MTFLVNLFVGLSMTFCIGLNDPGKNPGQYQDYVLNKLNPDCYYNWAIYSENNLDNPKFNPMLWKLSDGSINQARRLAKQYLGRTWLIYNEPEGSDQANTKPEEAAEWFDKAYNAIKEVDSTATIACCGVMVRNEGITWLDKFVSKVKNKPDVWHVHIYINSQNFNDWLSFWNWWLDWNKKTGNNLPVFITETCATYQESQDDLLLNLLNYQHPLLKRVYWFSAYPEPIVKDWKCNLLNADGTLTDLGKTFQTFTIPPNKLTPVPEPTLKPTATATITPTATKLPPTLTPTATPTITPTPIPTIDETTGEGVTLEPHQQKLYLPIVNN